ncbi:MAG: hypothetical protein GY787_18555 [Alteromonadales bacterium]|nr:hypothetical protein [Alteromonadales bacterium]
MSKLIKYTQVLLLLCLVSVTSACSALTKEVESPQAKMQVNSLAVIYGFNVTEKGLTFLVKSTGCTKENNFSLQTKYIDDKTRQISLYRTKRDLCRGMPTIISITLAFDDNNSDENSYVVVNPISAKPKRVKR